jgi:hypothetical protein
MTALQGRSDEKEEGSMIRQWIGVGFAVVLAAAALSACSGKGAGTSKGHSCGTGAPTTGQCGGAASCGSPPCKQGCTLQIAVVAGYPDTCSGEPDPCDTFPDQPGCIMQGCYWSDGDAGGETCGSDSGDIDADEGGTTVDAAGYIGTCEGTPLPCSDYYPPCNTPNAGIGCTEDFNGTINVCVGTPPPCSVFSSSPNFFGQPMNCRDYTGCTWVAD